MDSCDIGRSSKICNVQRYETGMPATRRSQVVSFCIVVYLFRHCISYVQCYFYAIKEV